jgi:uncharacterized membrane protein
MRTMAILLLAAVAVSACSSAQLYATGRNVQNSVCMQRADAQERERCLRDTELSHEEYRRQIEATER